MEGIFFNIYRGIYIHIAEGTDINLVRAVEDALIFDESGDEPSLVSGGCGFGPYSSQEVGLLFSEANRGAVPEERAKLPGTMAVHFSEVAQGYDPVALTARVTDGRLALSKISYEQARELSSEPRRFPKVLTEQPEGALLRSFAADSRNAIVRHAGSLEEMECYILAPAPSPG